MEQLAYQVNSPPALLPSHKDAGSCFGWWPSNSASYLAPGRATEEALAVAAM